MCIYTHWWWRKTNINASWLKNSGAWALVWVLTNSRIFPSSAHITIIFTYIETLLYPLSSYVHYILMCHPLLMSAGLVCGIVDVGAYNLEMLVLPPTTTGHATPSRCRESGYFRSLATTWPFNCSGCHLGWLCFLVFCDLIKLAKTCYAG